MGKRGVYGGMNEKQTTQEPAERPRSFPEAVLTPEQWEQVKQACIAGMSYRDAEKVFKVDYFAVKQRAWREEWPTPLKLEKMRREKSVTPVLQEGQLSEKRPETALQALTESMEGYRSRTILGLAKLAEKGVSRAVSADLPVENWQDAKLVADIAMKLHQVGQESVQVNICNAFADMGEGAVIETGAEIVGDDEGEDGGRDAYFIEDQ